MQKQVHKQSALIDDERLYIDIAPDLIKHAQDMRKQGWDDPPTWQDKAKEWVGKHPVVSVLGAGLGAGALGYGAIVGRDAIRDSRLAHKRKKKEEKDEKEKEASLGASADERLYIDIAPDLIKHAQDMRKEASWFYSPAPNKLLSPEELLYNKNLGQLLTVGGGAALLGGGAALIKALRRPSIEAMAGGGTSSLPIELSVPRRKLISRRKPEEDEEDQMDKAAQDPVKPKPSDPGILGSDWASVVKWPGIVAMGLGGFWGGNALGDYLAKRRRKRLRGEAVRDAKEEYEDAIAEQFETSKEASVLGSSLDELYGDFVKIAQGSQPDPYVPDWNPAELIPDWGKDYAGFLALAAAISGIPTAVMAYNWTRNKARTKNPLSEAVRRRKAELHRRRPQPVYITPGEEVLHEEKEDEPIVAAI